MMSHDCSGLLEFSAKVAGPRLQPCKHFLPHCLSRFENATSAQYGAGGVARAEKDLSTSNINSLSC
eukprot:1160697-Pelagomonas_calceolata.AAC.4